VTGISPVGAAVVENEPIDIGYELTVTTYGISGELPPNRPIVVCQAGHPAGSTCSSAFTPRIRRRYTGTVRGVAPAAGLAVPVTLVVEREPAPTGGETFAWDTVMEESSAVAIAARYEITVDGFEIFHTRSTTEDTVRVNLQAMIRSTPPHPSDGEDACRRERFDWCVIGAEYGDADDGRHTVTNVRVGPYLLVPEREEDLRFLFTIFNFGASRWQEVGRKVADGFSTAGMIVLTAGVAGGGSVAPVLDKAMKELHAAMFADCDGVTAADTRILPNREIADDPGKTLDAFTRATGFYRPDSLDHYREKDGNTICGSGGDYTVHWTVHRTSWRPAGS
jgi:hypothetical protein